MSVITISRQYGSLGNEIAALTCQLLGYQIFDRTLMAHLAARVGLSEDEVIDYSESKYKTPTILDQLVSLLTTPPGGSSSVTQLSTWQRGAAGADIRVTEGVNEARGVFIVGQTILAASQVGNVVIVGRSGQAVLQKTPGVLHVRVEAPLEIRLQRIQDQENLSLQDAQKLIARHDRDSAHYVRHFYNMDWSDPIHYHLVINTGKWDVEAAAQVLVHAVGLLKA